MRQVFEDKAAKARADLMVVKRSSAALLTPGLEDIMEEAERDQDVLTRATVGGLRVARQAYEWFSMDTRLQVLHDLYPSRSALPVWQDISKEVSRRWKALPWEKKQHYRDIAEYQIDKEAKARGVSDTATAPDTDVTSSSAVKQHATEDAL